MPTEVCMKTYVTYDVSNRDKPIGRNLCKEMAPMLAEGWEPWGFEQIGDKSSTRHGYDVYFKRVSA